MREAREESFCTHEEIRVAEEVMDEKMIKASCKDFDEKVRVKKCVH
jgi:hypothetical protein